SSEFGKLPAKMTKFQKTMETTERLLNEFAQTEYTVSIFLDDQATPVLESVSGRLRDFSKNTYKVSVSVDMRKVYTDIYAAERKIRRMQLQPSYGGGYVMPYTGGNIRGAGNVPVQTIDNEGFFDGAMSVGSAVVTANGLVEANKNFKKMLKPKNIPKSASTAITAFGYLDGGADIAEGVFSSDNAYDRTYKVAEGATVMAGSFVGSKAGAALGLKLGGALGPWGALAGAAGGYLLGKLLSEPVADSFADGIAGAEEYVDVSARAAEKVAQLKAEQKALASEQLDKMFGKTALSAREVSQVVGELFDTGQTMRINNAAAAINDLQGSFANLQQADYGLQKSLWLSGTEAGAGSLMGLAESTNDFGESSRMHLLDNQYAEEKSVKALLTEPGSADEILEGIDKQYREKLKNLDDLIEDLNQVTVDALSDGVVDESEQTKIDGIRQEVLQLLYGASGSDQGSQEERDFQAMLEKMKLGLGKEYSKDSFDAIIQEATAGANERIDALEDAYGYAAIGKTDKQKQTLLWGKDGTGQTDGLYKQEMDTYGAIAETALNEFTNKYSDKLAFLDNLSADMEDGKLSEEMLGNIRGLQNDPVDRAAIGEYVDSMKPLYNDMLETAKQYEEKGEALPEAVQDFMNKMELLGSIAQNRAGSWYLQHYEPEYLKEDGNKNVFNNLPDRVKKMHYNPAGVKYRGGIVAPAFAEGGYVHGGAQLITVAEEGTPEAIIPLGKHRRKRALQLFNQVGGYLEAPGFSPKGFAAGGIVGGSIGSLSGSGGSGMPIAVEVGGVEIKVEAKDGQSLVETIRENKEAISEEIAGVFNAAFKGQFANTPAAGGAGL
ncbi:MAG: hypothetical protein HFE71_12450, partial [Emergencia sp.]|nr:hypothetical protein [Emergencia sp.]